MPVVGEPERILYRSAAFQDKLFSALATIRQALARSRKPYIAFTGGKDSTAVMVLCELVAPGIPLCWSDDELELDETIAYMHLLQSLGAPLRVFPGFATHAGWFTPWTDRPFWRAPFPGTVAAIRDFQDELADEGYDLVLLGTRMEENARRRAWLAQSGPIYGGTTITRRCCPIWDWTADDVWALIAGQGIPYNAAYDVMEDAGIVRRMQRVGPLPLAPRRTLAAAWPDLLARLEARYGRWAD